MRRTLIPAAAAVAVLALATTAPGAAARPVQNEPFTDSSVEVVKGFCGVDGLDVQVTETTAGRVLVNTRGPDKRAYFTENVSVQLAFTVLDDAGVPVGDPAVTAVGRTHEADLRITPGVGNQDTIQVLVTGNFTVYDAAGKAIARNPGQVRFTVLIDNGGTPGDISDDTFIADVSFDKGSTGRTDDFCAAAVPELLG